MPLNFTIYQKLLDKVINLELFYYQASKNKPVTIQNRIGQLVGNLINNIKTLQQYNIKNSQSSSETIRENSFNNAKYISDHQVKFQRYKCNSKFGYYLAGLIEGVGYFSLQNQQVIAFHIKDVSQAYYIKKYIGYGTVIKIKEKEAIKFVITSRIGIKKVIGLINGKMRTENKHNQQNMFLKKHGYNEIQLPQDTSSFIKNPWQTGFIDADGSFQIKQQNRINRKQPEVRQAQQIDQKTRQIQDQIKKEFGGSIGYRKTQDTYYYSSVNFGIANQYLEYFKKFNLLSYKYINYLRWRKVYIMISKKEHLTNIGINKIKKQKE